MHISELAAHHVENPREVVSQGDPVNVLILEIDGERRRLSLSLKRVEEGAVPVPRADGGESVFATPNLRLSEEAFPAGAASTETADEVVVEEVVVEESAAGDEVVEEVVVDEVVVEETVGGDEVVEEVVVDEVVVEETVAGDEVVEEVVVDEVVVEDTATEAGDADEADATEA